MKELRQTFVAVSMLRSSQHMLIHVQDFSRDYEFFIFVRCYCLRQNLELKETHNCKITNGPWKFKLEE